MIHNDGVSYFSVSMARPSVEPRVAEIYAIYVSFIVTHWLDSLMATAWHRVDSG